MLSELVPPQSEYSVKLSFCLHRCRLSLPRGLYGMTYTFRAGDLPKLDLDVDRVSDFLAWEKQWNSYMILSGLAGSDAAIKVHALQYCMSRDTLTIVDNLGLTEAQRADQAQIITALKQYVLGRVNETVERRNFRQRK